MDNDNYLSDIKFDDLFQDTLQDNFDQLTSNKRISDNQLSPKVTKSTNLNSFSINTTNIPSILLQSRHQNFISSKRLVHRNDVLAPLLELEKKMELKGEEHRDSLPNWSQPDTMASLPSTSSALTDDTTRIDSNYSLKRTSSIFGLSSKISSSTFHDTPNLTTSSTLSDNSLFSIPKPKHVDHVLQMSNSIRNYKQLLVDSPKYITVEYSENLDFDDKYEVAHGHPPHSNLRSPYEPVHQLPIKRIYDFKTNSLREAPKLPKEFMIANNQTIIFKVKLIGLNYKTEFKPFNRILNAGNSIVPGFRIIGKISLASEPFDSSSKYLVYPYTTCYHQSLDQLCDNCQHIDNLAKLNQLNFEKYYQYPCSKQLIYGYTLDGGLQDYMKIVNPNANLIQLPGNVSTHDSLYLFDNCLPLYSFLKQKLGPTFNKKNLAGRSLFIVSSVDKVINDLLIVLDHCKINQKSVMFMDPKMIKKLSTEEYQNYLEMFNHIFVFDFSPTSLQFAKIASVSSGLEATQARYSMVLFDQFNQVNLETNPFLTKTKDKTWYQFHLGYEHKHLAHELLHILSKMNILALKDEKFSSSATYAPSSASTLSSSSIDLEDNSDENPPKLLRFRSTESVIYDKGSTYKTSTPGQRRPLDHYSWLWYERDFNLVHDESIDDFHGERKNHTVRHINHLMKKKIGYERVCYTNKTSRSCKIDSFIMC